jgi:SAM-dependent methyltransferase
MGQRSSELLSTFDIAEAYLLSHAVLALYNLRILAALKRPLTAETLARKRGLDSKFLRGILEYVAARTDFVSKTGKRFATTQSYSNRARFLLELYTGAYRSNADQLENLMRKPSLAMSAVNRRRHARAFEEAGGLAVAWIAQLIRKLQLNYILDIGCGPATLLVQLALLDPKFVGWGLEKNPGMCKAARVKIRGACAGKRVKLLEGDSNHLPAVLPMDVTSNVQAVTACQVANEMFAAGSSHAVRWLRGIRGMLPGRILLLSDYYGRLGSETRGNHRETLLHDYAQLISGQGVPPANITEWSAIYTAAGCRLVHVIEDRRTTRFMHIVIL